MNKLYEETKVPFRVVRGLESNILNKEAQEGHLYFTTDSNKIYLGNLDGFLPMCDSKGILYGIKDIQYDDTGNEPDPNVEFMFDEIENGEVPEVNDLILNKDGCFYKVLAVSDSGISTYRQTLQGSGPSTPGGGSGSATFAISAVGGTTKYFSKDNTISEIGLIARSSDLTNQITQIECSLTADFLNPFLVDATERNIGIPQYINIAPYLKQFNTVGVNTVYVRVTDKYAISRTLIYSIYVVSLNITTNEGKLFNIEDNSFNYTCSIGSTGTITINDKTLYYTLKDADGIQQYEPIGVSLVSSVTGDQTIEILLANEQKEIQVSHGIYDLEVWLEGEVGGVTLKSNILTHKVIRYDVEQDQPLLAVFLPEVMQQYSEIKISYLLSYGKRTNEYELEIDINDKNETIQLLTSGKEAFYNAVFDSNGTYALRLHIPELNLVWEKNIEITKYSSVLPVISGDAATLVAYLTPRGRTNNAADKEYWPDKRNANKAKLNNFYFGQVNGWMNEEGKDTYLKISQGANLIFDDISPLAPLSSSTSKGITIELDFQLSNVTDYTKSLIECLSLDDQGVIYTGFQITGDKFKYYANGVLVTSLDLFENKRIKLSYVIEPSNAGISSTNGQAYPMCYTYLNGIVSNGVRRTGENINWSNIAGSEAYLKASSEFGEISLYGLRYYNEALSDTSILNNYQATLPTLEERQSSYYSNLIKDNNVIDLRLIENGEYKLNIPYVKIIGGYGAANNKDMTMADEVGNVLKLPTGKKDYRNIDIEVHYPSKEDNSYFEGYEDFILHTTFDDPNITIFNGFGKTPTDYAAVMYAQGTSSMEYPVKNLRVKFKGKQIKVRPDLDPVNLICFKADYMESSGSHNTGAANYIDRVYGDLNMQTPGQKRFSTEELKKVTCIKGHPCIIFWSKDGENFEYIGKYNLNLDKATPEPFGFDHDESDFGYEYNEQGEKINSIYCFEFLDNQSTICNFKPTPTDKLGDDFSHVPLGLEDNEYAKSWYGNIQGKSKPGWTDGFESRYPDEYPVIGDEPRDPDDWYDADALWPLASWINELYTLSESGNRQLAISRFQNEYERFFDNDFLIAYYAITEVLLMIDSRVKNMMIATWGRGQRTIKNINGEEEQTNDYIWYPIFYDMDTMLGLDNTGKRNKNYYDEDTTIGVYNGGGVLWEFVRDALQNQIVEFYAKYDNDSKGTLKTNTILEYFNKNQADMANETLYNEDAKYKYIVPYRNGYKNDADGSMVAPGVDDRLYVIQGNRSLMREWFISNRLRFLYGKYHTDSFSGNNAPQITARYTNPNKITTGRYADSTSKVPATTTFNFEAFQHGFVGYKLGANVAPIIKKVEPGEKIEISGPATDANGTELYIVGVTNITDLGDLSDKYLENFKTVLEDNRIKKLKLGNSYKEYYNDKWIGTQALDLNGYSLLEHFDFTNCDQFTGNISLTNCTKLKTILMTNNQKYIGNGDDGPMHGVNTIDLPVNGVIEELRLPYSIKQLTIENHPNLSKDKFTLGYYDYGNNSDFIDDDSKYINVYDKLTAVKIINTPIDSYSIAKEAGKNSLKHYAFVGINWTITDTDFEFDSEDTNKVIGFTVLDKLLTLTPYDTTRDQALTGKITIDLNGHNIDEYNIYTKYQTNDKYPNITFEFINGTITAAPIIKFYISENIEVDPFFYVLTDKKKDLKELTINMPIPTKAQTHDTVYTFEGDWQLINGSIDDNYIAPIVINESQFEQLIPKNDLIFVAQFKETDRLYKATLYDDNGQTILLEYNQLKWHDDIGSILQEQENGYRVTYNYKPYTNEKDETNQYIFTGWQSPADYNDSNKLSPTWSTIIGKKLEGNFVAYACYQLQDYTKTPTNIDYFITGSTNMTVQFDDTNITENGIYIAMKNIYKPYYQGVLTLPAKTSDGKIINFIGNNLGAGFANMPYITELRVEPGNKYIGIGETAFRQTNKIQNGNLLNSIYLPDSIWFINNQAFTNNINLKNIYTQSGENNLPNGIKSIGSQAFGIDTNFSGSVMQFNLTKLPDVLEYLGTSAFYNCSQITVSNLPDTLKIINNWVFASCPNLQIETFGNTNAQSGLQTINANAFKNSGKSVVNIIINDSVTFIQTYGKSSSNVSGDAAFDGYGKENEILLTVNGSELTNRNTILDNITTTIGNACIALKLDVAANAIGLKIKSENNIGEL